MIEPRILEAFHIMWSHFPEPVLLVHKNRTILATNELARTIGIPVGTKCHTQNTDLGPDGHCRRCQANQALRLGETVVTSETLGSRQIRSYWMPLKEVQDVYVHFGIGTAEAMAEGACQS